MSRPQPQSQSPARERFSAIPSQRNGSEDPNLEGVDRLYRRQARAAMVKLALAEFTSQPRSRQEAQELTSTVNGVMDRLDLGSRGALADARNLATHLNKPDYSAHPREVPSHAPSGNMPSPGVRHQ